MTEFEVVGFELDKTFVDVMLRKGGNLAERFSQACLASLPDRSASSDADKIARKNFKCGPEGSRRQIRLEFPLVRKATTQAPDAPFAAEGG